ncbi:fumarylacetoacetate hydrolase family protein [Brevundimonas pishanensis]|uniref:fumarylacetoacetate hydrolase family protein n=1 Tax=Brevundimonas pishanensis TaxID=2896315 RepID=UPI001FA6EE83|nr:fumarylacetoacetate hydrolase family protein [Brevundimonas pishanensis]
MTDWLIAPAPAPSLPIEGDNRRFAVRRIYCVGQNYAAHAREMGADASKPDPFFFSKPADAVVVDGRDPSYPPATANLHYEVELVVALGEGGKPVGWGVGVDLTRRDVQSAAKAAGRPWDAAKGFDQSAPCGALSLTPPAADATIRLSVNGEVRQSGRLDDMIWDVEGVLGKASGLWKLAAGDLVFTGTPEGVGPLQIGDAVEAVIEGLPPLRFVVQP